MKIFAESDRLILREILPTDEDGMFELDRDPEVHKYLGNNPLTSRTQVIENINAIRQQYIDYGIGRWAIIYKPTNEFIGWSGLKWMTYVTNGHANYYDVGYRLIKRYWGKGIAQESAEMSLDYAFNKLKTNKVHGMAHVDNIASNKILKNIGLNLIESFRLEDTDHNWYKITRQQYVDQNLHRK